MKEFSKLNEFKNLKFHCVIPQDILQAVELLGKIGYEAEDGFSADDAAKHNGVCAWDDGEVTEGWLDANGFEQVTLEGLKEMVGAIKNNQLVLWLNNETLEERYLDKFSVFPYHSSWIEVPDGATFATGDKDNFIFRKDGWYYDEQNGGWVETNVFLKHFPEYKYIKLFWVKGDQDNTFTLKRLLGCEVLFGDTLYHVNYIYYAGAVGHLVLGTDTRGAYVSDLSLLTFFTEDGDELTFDEYVAMYYGE